MWILLIETTVSYAAETRRRWFVGWALSLPPLFLSFYLGLHFEPAVCTSIISLLSSVLRANWSVDAFTSSSRSASFCRRFIFHAFQKGVSAGFNNSSRVAIRQAARRTGVSNLNFFTSEEVRAFSFSKMIRFNVKR